MIQVINRALDILEYIAKDRDQEHNLSAIADHLGLNHATCANIMKTLVTRNYLEQVGKKRGYILGNQIFNITGCIPKYQYLVELAKGPMKKLTQELNEGTILSIIRQDIRVLLHEEKGKNELQVNIIAEKPVYATSTGRMILSHYDESSLETFVNRYGLPEPEIWQEIEDFEDLVRELGKIRKKEICIQESRHHIVGIAVPIYQGGKVVAALGTYMPAMRFDVERRQAIIDKLVDTGHKLNQYLEEYE